MTAERDERPAFVPSDGEDALIAAYWAPLADGLPGALGLKDDCGVIAPPPGEELVVTTDALIAGVHFLPGEDPAAIGWKALAVNVSDLIAKGAKPTAYLLSIALPSADAQWLARFTAGLREAQEAFGCRLIGGDTDRTPGLLTVTIAAFGSVPAGCMVQRTTARAGDDIYVSGTIGDAALGLMLAVDTSTAALGVLPAEARAHVRERFSRPRPPIGLAGVLRECASAAMDVSDGLIKDLSRMCRASGVGARIEAVRVPLSPAAHLALAGGLPLAALLTGGEDYEVLFTAPSARRTELEKGAGQMAARITRIGEVMGHPEVSVLDADGRQMQFERPGWDHFRDSGPR